MRGSLFWLLMFLGVVPLAAAASLQDEMRDLERRSFQAIQRSDGSQGFRIRSSLRRVSAAASDLRTGPAGDPDRMQAYVQARNEHLALLGVPVQADSSLPAPDPYPASLSPREEAAPAPARATPRREERRKRSLFSRLRSSLFGEGDEERGRDRKGRHRDEGTFVLDPVPPQPEDFMRAQSSGLNPYHALQQHWAEQ